MSDWYEEGFEKLRDDASETLDISIEQFVSVYSYLSSIGLIDYDIEKEVIWELYGEED